MGLKDYEEAAGLMKEHPEMRSFVGPRDESLVRAAEETLGVELPATYRRFLLDYGAGSFGASEIYGVINDDFENSSVPDAVWRTLVERDEGELPDNLVVIYEDGAGAAFCLDCADAPHGESPVVAFYVGFPPSQQPEEIIAEDFGAFLLQRVRRELTR